MRISKKMYVIAAAMVIAGVALWHLIPTYTTHSVHATMIRKNGCDDTHFQHVVVIMMENHTFDNLFGRYPGANGDPNLQPASNPQRADFDHTGPAAIAAIDGGKMDKFPQRSFVQYTQQDIPDYWAYAQQFGLGDNFFSSFDTNSTPNHMAMVAAEFRWHFRYRQRAWL